VREGKGPNGAIFPALAVRTASMVNTAKPMFPLPPFACHCIIGAGNSFVGPFVQAIVWAVFPGSATL